MLLRFGLVGCLGFLVDGGILTLLVSGLSWHHYSARAVSFAAAVTTTWALNRRWVFSRTHDSRREYAQYFGVQAVGAAINLGTYVAVIEAWPELGSIPVVPLAIGAALGLLFNFFVARSLIYERGRRTARGNPTQSSYSGRENLEAMKHARNYNRYLSGLIDQHAPEGVVLDFGAGAGTFALPLAQSGRKLICVEPDDSLRHILEKSALNAVSDIHSIVAESIDYIYSLNVLEHIADDAAILKTLRSKLRPGGVLLIYVPAFEILFSAMDEHVGHFRRYRMGPLKQLIADSGLVVQRAAYVDCLGFLAALAYRAFGSSTGTVGAGSVRLYDRIAFPISLVADRAFSTVCGKNLLVVARRPS